MLPHIIGTQVEEKMRIGGRTDTDSASEEMDYIKPREEDYKTNLRTLELDCRVSDLCYTSRIKTVHMKGNRMSQNRGSCRLYIFSFLYMSISHLVRLIRFI